MRHVRLGFVQVLGLLLLVGGALVPAVMGQQVAAAEPVPQDVVGSDAHDDVQVKSGDGSVPPQNASQTAQADTLDIRQLVVGKETAADFQVSLTMKALPAPTDPRISRAVYFDFEGVKYRVVMYAQGQGRDPNEGQFQSYDPGVERYRTTKVLTGTTDTSTKTVTFTIPREIVVNADHSPLGFNDKLSNITATASRQMVGGFFLVPNSAYMVDRVPDEGFLPEFQLALGRVGSGLIALTTEEPIRVSNGESTTVVYKVHLMNKGATPIKAQLEAQQVPGDWTVRVPALVDIGADEVVTFPVIASIPFNHQHGKTATFTVRAEAIEDSNTWSSLELGIYWTETPQPAGHHPEMWLHSSLATADNDFSAHFMTAYPFRNAWFNPLDVDPEPGTDDANVPAFFNNEMAQFLFTQGTDRTPPNGNDWTTEWFMPLSPELLIGIDLDSTKQGFFQAAVLHSIPSTSYLDVRLLYCDPNAGGRPINCTNVFQGQWLEIPLASGKSEPRATNRDETVGYEIPLTVDPSGEFLPYERGANIALHILLHSDRPQNGFTPQPRPELVLKGSTRAMIRLPLIEYHDPIDQAFKEVGSLKLTSLSPFEKKVNPGETVVFEFLLNNTGSQAEEVDVEITGVNIGWVTLVGEPRYTLLPGGSQRIQVKAAPPAGTPELDQANMVLVAQSINDATIVSAVRLRATVVTAEDVPDESGLVQGQVKKDTPSITVPLALVGLGVLVAVRRRRA